jgi:hypothetical protein
MQHRKTHVYLHLDLDQTNQQLTKKSHCNKTNLLLGHIGIMTATSKNASRIETYQNPLIMRCNIPNELMQWLQKDQCNINNYMLQHNKNEGSTETDHCLELQP